MLSRLLWQFLILASTILAASVENFLPVHTIHLKVQPEKCLGFSQVVDTEGNAASNVDDCGNTPQWMLSDQKIRISGSNKCLDTSPSVEPDKQALIYLVSCDNVAHQVHLSDDGSIRLHDSKEDKDFCVEVPEGYTSHIRLVQLSDCVPGNVNQIWNARSEGFVNTH